MDDNPTIRICRELWPIVRNCEGLSLLADGMEPARAFYNFSSWVPSGPPRKIDDMDWSVEPLFKNLEISMLPALRRALQEGRRDHELLAWVEKIMRYCEVWSSELTPKLKAKWEQPGEASRALLEIGACMIDGYFQLKDIRYLNISLKLLDSDLMMAIGRIEARLGQSGGQQHEALLAYRLYLLTEFAIADLRQKKGV